MFSQYVAYRQFVLFCFVINKYLVPIILIFVKRIGFVVDKRDDKSVVIYLINE